MSSELPEGWAVASLSSLLREPLRNGHSAKASGTGEEVRTLTLTAVTYGDFSERNTKVTTADPQKVRELWLEESDILVERSNTPELVGTARMYRGPRQYAIFPDLLIRVRLVPSLPPTYIELFLQTTEARTYFRERAQGTAGSMPKIDQAAIEELQIPIPPLTEQQRVVAKVEALLARANAARQRLAKVPAILKRFRQSVLAAACSGRLTADWRENNSAPPLEDESDLLDVPDVPDTWIWKRLSAIAETKGGVTKGRKFKGNSTIMLPYLRVANVQDGYLDLAEIKHIEVLPEDKQKYALEPGDILFTEGGDRDELGRGTVWRGEITGCIHQNHIFRARLITRAATPEYISIAAKSDFSFSSQTVNLASL